MLFCVLFLGVTWESIAQRDQYQEAINRLKVSYPGLMGQFGDKLVKEKAHYVIIIDVSASMNKFRDIVNRGLISFISTLHDDDLVTIITTGNNTTVLNERISIDNNQINTLNNNLKSIRYSSSNTDLVDMMHQLHRVLAETPDGILNFVFMFTDFNNEPPESSLYYNWKDVLVWDELKELYGSLGNKKLDCQAIKLQSAVQGLYCYENVRQIIPSIKTAPADKSNLEAWFKNKRMEILKERLKLLVSDKLSKDTINFTFSEDNNVIFLNYNLNDSSLIENLRLNNIKIEPEPNEFRLTLIENTITLGKTINQKEVASIKFNDNPLVKKSFLLKTNFSFDYSREYKYNNEIENLFQNDNSVKEDYLNTKPEKTEINLEINNGILPLWIALIIVLVLLIIIFYAVFSYIRPYKINGSFLVIIEENGRAETTTSKDAYNLSVYEIGKVNDKFFQLPGVSWKAVFKVKKYPYYLTGRKTGVYCYLEGANAEIELPGHYDKISSNNFRIPKGTEFTITNQFLNLKYIISYQEYN